MIHLYILIILFGAEKDSIAAPLDRFLTFARLSSEHGLSQVSINEIIQDRRGYLWIATDGGLNRYDGNQFKVYFNQRGDPATLSDNSISCMLLSRGGNLLVGTRNGDLNICDPLTEKFQLITTDDWFRKNGMKRSEIFSMLEIDTSAGPEWWIGTGVGDLWVIHGEQVFQLEIPFSSSAGMQSRIVRTLQKQGDEPNQGVWVGTDQGLFRYDLRTKRWDSIDLSISKTMADTLSVRAVVSNSTGDILVATWGEGLFVLTSKGELKSRFLSEPERKNTLPSNFLTSILCDREGRTWIGSIKGLGVFSPGTSEVMVYSHHPQVPWTLTDDYVNKIFQDRSNVIWIGTWNGGLSKIDGKPNPFKTQFHIPGDSSTLSENKIKDMIEEKSGVLWVATVSGLDRYDPATELFTQFIYDSSDEKSLSDDYILDLYKDSSDDLWIGTLRGLNRYRGSPDKGFDRFFYDAQDPLSLSNDSIQRILEDLDDPTKLWVGTRDNGLNYFDKTSGKCKRYLPGEGPGSISGSKIYAMCFDSKKRLWVGTFDGLNLFEKTYDRFIHYQNQKNDPNSLSNNRITTLLPDPTVDHYLWVGTWGGGLNRLDMQSGTCENFADSKDYDTKLISGILSDPEGILWVSTIQGIIRLNPGTGEYKLYKVKLGNFQNAFNAGAYSFGPSGKIYFGGLLGLTEFYPGHFAPNPFPPELALNLVSFPGLEKDVPRVSECPEVVLYPKQKIVTFEIAGMEFTDSALNRYAYKLEGFDSNWHEVDSTQRQAVYTNLGAGEYQFVAKASNNDGVWSEEKVLATVEVIPPFWNTLFFKLMMSICFVGLFTGGLRLWMNRVNVHRTQLEELVQKRTFELVEKSAQLQKINNMVKAINAEIEWPRILEAILRESQVFENVTRAYVLLYSHESRYFHINTCIGLDLKVLEGIQWTPEEVQARYLDGTEEVTNGIFLVKGVEHRAGGAKIPIEKPETMLVIPFYIHDHLEGMLIFDNQTRFDFDPQRIQLLNNIKDHLISAFLKVNLLNNLQKANKSAVDERQVALAASRSKSEFLANMSHEIRTPMNAVIGFAEMLGTTRLTDDQVEFVSIIKQSGDALLNLINDILDFSKIEAGKLELEEMPFSPENLLFEAFNVIISKLELKDVEPICLIDDNVPHMLIGDPFRFRQVAVNLLGNAAKFTVKGRVEGHLSVVEQNSEACLLRLSVTDTGIGIPENQISTIFQEFQQADGSITRKFGGTGLGLSICHQLARLFKGKVWVESALNQGSTFHFQGWFPIPSDSSREEIPLDAFYGKKAAVMIQHPLTRKIVASYLEQWHFHVTEVERPIDLFSSDDKINLADIWILDTQATGALHFLESLQAMSDPPDTPVIAITKSSQSNLGDLRAAGITRIVNKPVQRDKLFGVLAKEFGKSSEDDLFVSVFGLTRADILGRNPPVLLLVEDNPFNQKLVQTMLEKAGYQLELAVNGLQAVEKITENPKKFGLVLMDVQMPEMDGKEATREIRRRGFTEIPIIAMTAQAMKGDREKCLQAGMDDYVSKPIKRTVVLKIIEQWLRYG